MHFSLKDVYINIIFCSKITPLKSNFHALTLQLQLYIATFKLAMRDLLLQQIK
jgi:hypothetical protein